MKNRFIYIIVCILVAFTNSYLAMQSLNNYRDKKTIYNNNSYRVIKKDNKLNIISNKQIVINEKQKSIEKNKNYYIINNYYDKSELDEVIDKYKDIKVKKTISIINKNKIESFDSNNNKTIVKFNDKLKPTYINNENEVGITNIKFIYQNIEENKKYQCADDGAYLNEDYKIHGCMLVNFVMFNNAVNEKQTSVEQLYNEGYSCHFDYNKALKEYNYKAYEFIDLKQDYATKSDAQFPNQNMIINNKKDTFSLKDVLIYNEKPIMLWVVPNKDNNLREGHLITIYKYDKQNNDYFFYDSFNKKTPSRSLNDFMKRWKIAQLYILN